VPRPGEAITADEILALFAGRIARFKHPHAAIVADSLPKNALGKVLRYRLREMAASSAPTASPRSRK
jgi:fatty-acyl-CoA synthase